jgi:hypothetical protein
MTEAVKQYYVQIVKFDGEEVVKEIGPLGDRQASKVDRGANINLNHERFYTRIVSK